MAVKVTLKIEGIDFLKNWARDKHGPAFEAAVASAGELWKREFLPRHFTFEAYRLYNYQPRARSTAARSRRINGRALPLVRTGQLRRMATGEAGPATGKGGRLQVVIPAPYYINFKRQIRDELTRVHPSELRAMAEEVVRAYALIFEGQEAAA